MSYKNFSAFKPNFQKIKKTEKNYISLYRQALVYASTELTPLDLKKEVIQYIKNNPSDSVDIEFLKSIPENKLAVVGKYFYIARNGGELPEDVQTSLIPSLIKVIDEEKEKDIAKMESRENDQDQAQNKTIDKIGDNSKSGPSIQDRIKEKTREIAGEVEGWLDDLFLDKKLSAKSVDEFVGLIKGNDLKAPHAKFMKEIFQRRHEEILAVIDGKDKLLVEGYSNFAKPELKKFDAFYKNLFKACDMLQESARADRAPRKKKPVSQEKLVSKLKYRKEDNTLGIVSLPPVQILGSKEVWIYNTKTRKLAQYKTLDTRGILVQGTSLDNFSSESKEKTLRKPAETIAEFKKASKVKLRTFLADLSTIDTAANGRLNEHCIILRIDK